jgi:hypothetical protein
MSANPTPLCWICHQRPADSGEHRFKASDIRTKFRGLSQRSPLFLQRDGRATNKRIGKPEADALKFEDSICRHCNGTGTQPYDRAWEHLSQYLHANWKLISRLRYFNLAKPFPGRTREAALEVHLFFVKLFGCKIIESGTRIDLNGFSQALLDRKAHPDVCLQVVDATHRAPAIAAQDTDVYTTHNQRRELDGATWGYRIHPVGIKVHWIRRGAPLRVSGYAWHPSTSGKIVRLSPYEGATEPIAGPKAWIDDERDN